MPGMLAPCKPTIGNLAGRETADSRPYSSQQLPPGGHEGSPLCSSERGVGSAPQLAVPCTVRPSDHGRGRTPGVRDVDAQLLQLLGDFLDATLVESLECSRQKRLGGVWALVVAQHPAEQELHGGRDRQGVEELPRTRHQVLVRIRACKLASLALCLTLLRQALECGQLAWLQLSSCIIQR